jgi:deoxycytidylate deaminase
MERKPKQIYHLTAIIRDKKGNILSIGRNKFGKTHPMMYAAQKRIGVKEVNKAFIHAEIDAIVRLPDLKKAYSIEVYRPLKSGGYGISKPCEICSRAIKEFTPIKEIKYFFDGKFVVERI